METFIAPLVRDGHDCTCALHQNLKLYALFAAIYKLSAVKAMTWLDLGIGEHVKVKSFHGRILS